jgi:hypothetical protein
MYRQRPPSRRHRLKTFSSLTVKDDRQVKYNMSTLKQPLLAVVTLFGAIAQLLAPSFHPITGLGSSFMQATNATIVNAPEVPAGYAFSIWGVIFTVSLIFAVVQALPHQWGNPVFTKLRLPLMGAFWSASLWMVLLQLLGEGWYLAVIIWLMLGFALTAFITNNTLLKTGVSVNTGFQRWGVNPLVGLFSGWLSIAVFLNTSSVLRFYQWEQLFDRSIWSTQQGIVTLVLACLFGGMVLIKTQGNRWYGGTLLWGLVGVIVANTVKVPNPTVTMVAIGLAVGVLGLTLLLNNKQSALK